MPFLYRCWEQHGEAGRRKKNERCSSHYGFTKNICVMLSAQETVFLKFRNKFPSMSCNNRKKKSQWRLGMNSRFSKLKNRLQHNSKSEEWKIKYSTFCVSMDMPSQTTPLKIIIWELLSERIFIYSTLHEPYIFSEVFLKMADLIAKGWEFRILKKKIFKRSLSEVGLLRVYNAGSAHCAEL
jgi:hypothetical protein